MPKRSSIKRPRDFNQLAALIVQEATEPKTVQTPVLPAKNQAAVELGRLGGLKGGAARAKKLSAKTRSAIAKKAAAARWSKQTGQVEVSVQKPRKKAKVAL
jgi:hypothetical protein